MTVSREFTRYIMDLLAPLGHIESRRLFGGVGIKHNDTQFAMIVDNLLYFVVDDATREKYRAANSKPFSYNSKRGRVVVQRYYQVPHELFEQRRTLLQWASESLDIAVQTRS